PFGEADARTYKGWVKRGGYEMLAHALTLAPAAITDLVKESGLRGRGGAGFPTGLKWSFMPKEKKKPHYLCVNADESEPGTFKDREIMRWTPHALLEGSAIAMRAIQAEVAYIYIRGEFTEPFAIMAHALTEATAAGAFGDLKIYLQRGAGAYICGEETALMNSIEGKRGNPRIKPPFPAAFGVIVFDDSADMVYQIMRLARFYAHESCAQCTQCREGTAWTTKILERILAGQGKATDLDLLLDLAENMTGKTICVLSDSCAAPV